MTWQMAEEPQWTDEIHPEMLEENQNISNVLGEMNLLFTLNLRLNIEEANIKRQRYDHDWPSQPSDIHIKVQQT